jgi:hypothetical protein
MKYSFFNQKLIYCVKDTAYMCYSVTFVKNLTQNLNNAN